MLEIAVCDDDIADLECAVNMLHIIIPAPSLIKSIIPPRQKSIAHVLIRFPVTLHIFSVFNPV